MDIHERSDLATVCKNILWWLLFHLVFIFVIAHLIDCCANEGNMVQNVFVYKIHPHIYTYRSLHQLHTAYMCFLVIFSSAVELE